MEVYAYLMETMLATGDLEQERVLAWDADVLHAQVLTIPKSRAAFTSNIPEEGPPQACYPVFARLLGLDPDLASLRFRVVPAVVSEDAFWAVYWSKLREVIRHHVQTRRESILLSDALLPA